MYQHPLPSFIIHDGFLLRIPKKRCKKKKGLETNENHRCRKNDANGLFVSAFSNRWEKCSI